MNNKIIVIMFFCLLGREAMGWPEFFKSIPEAHARVDRASGTLTLEGEIFPSRWNAQEFPDIPGDHHFLTSRHGKAAKKALIETNVDDREISRLLIEAGLKPGDNLTTESWTKIGDPACPDPDLRVAGPNLKVEVEIGSRTLSFAELLSGGSGVELRFGGHDKFIDQWRSGCIICLYSCPGARISNAARSLRDGIDKSKRLKCPPDLPIGKDGTKVFLKIYY